MINPNRARNDKSKPDTNRPTENGDWLSQNRNIQGGSKMDISWLCLKMVLFKGWEVDNSLEGFYHGTTLM